MNHFDEVDFSECHSEEVISFFWRSVYMSYMWHHLIPNHIILLILQMTWMISQTIRFWFTIKKKAQHGRYLFHDDDNTRNNDDEDHNGGDNDDVDNDDFCVCWWW